MPMSALGPLCPSCGLREAQLPLNSVKFLEIEAWEYPYSFKKAILDLINVKKLLARKI